MKRFLFNEMLDRARLLGVFGLFAVVALPACVTAPPAASPSPRPQPTTTAQVWPAPTPVPLVTAAPTATPPADAVADADADSDDGDDEGPDDEDTYADGAPPTTATPAPTKSSNPLLALSEADVQARYKKDPASLGPLSVGKPNAGALVNGVNMPTSSKWIVLEPGLAWGTQETIDGISKAIERVHTNFPATQPIPIGHISSKHGGYLPVHKSHQAGRDVDLGYYFTTAQTYFVNGTKANLDLPRTLDLIKGFFAASDVEMIFIDNSIQKLLVEYAVAHNEDAAWLDRTFAIRQKQGVFAPIRHVRGHKNHIHVRFASPTAVALGRRIAGLVAIHPAPPPSKGGPSPSTSPGEKLIAHKARSGDTLVILAKRYGSTVGGIVRVNGIKGTALKAGHIYQIPVPAPAHAAPAQHTSPPTAQKHPKKGKSGG